jgi:hypothetical protein
MLKGQDGIKRTLLKDQINVQLLFVFDTGVSNNFFKALTAQQFKLWHLRWNKHLAS